LVIHAGNRTTDNRLVTSGWSARYPDLVGKVVVVTGESTVLFEVTVMLVANGAMPAVVAPDRSIVDEATSVADASGRAVLGMTVDPSQPATWDRIAAHIEQRLGPIDVVVVIGPEPTRRVVVDALLPDMAARGRGVIVEAGAAVAQRSLPDGVRHRAIQGTADVAASDLAQVALLCASDTLAAPELLVVLGQPLP
jgi:NAD(P)-dependent dehydrogenase (short-subunit alcohol dehydrogenase family)